MNSEAMKACPTLKPIRDIYMHMHTAIYMYSASRAYHSALAPVVFLLPAYFIAPLKIHTELEKALLVHVTCANAAFIFSTLAGRSKKKGEETSKSNF